MDCFGSQGIMAARGRRILLPPFLFLGLPRIGAVMRGNS